MKLLEIRDNLGYYLDANNAFVLIDKITKEDLLRLVDQTLNKDVEFDEYNDEAVKNQAHQILYKSIFEKLQDLKVRRKEFTDESKRLYLQEHEWYRKK
ncbi:MAG: hypothetical protein WC481_02665 [Candidatus Omnitrophota bacterium]